MGKDRGCRKGPKAIFKATKESSLTPWKKQEKKNNALDGAKVGRRELLVVVNTVETHMIPIGAQPMAGSVLDVGNSTTSSRYAKVKAGRCQRKIKDVNQLMTHSKMNEDKQITVQEFDMVISKVFNFQSVTSVIIVMFKKSSQKWIHASTK